MTINKLRDIWTFSAIAPWEKGNGSTHTKIFIFINGLILMASDKNSIICNPFSGSSTTEIAANLLNRQLIGLKKGIYKHICSKKSRISK